MLALQSNNVDKYLIENFGILGLIIFFLAVGIIALAIYIARQHKADKKQWMEERKEWRQTLDKNTDAINQSTNVNISLRTLLETLVQRQL